MNKRKTLLMLTLALACAAAVLWLGAGCIDRDYQCGEDSVKLTRRTHDVLVKHYPLIMRLPYSPQPEPEFLRDENGDMTDTWGIVILTDEEIDQDALYVRYGIPDSLEGVPVQVLPKEIGDKERPWYPGWGPDHVSDPHWHYSGDVLGKNWDLIQRYPFHTGQTSSFTFLRNDPNNSDAIIWIVVTVTEKVDPSTLPQEDRIPDCLEDVPVDIILDR